MESRDIYNRTRKTIEWDSNWIHIGTGNKIEKELIANSILDHFNDQEYIMLKRGRTNSQLIQIRIAAGKIISLMGKLQNYSQRSLYL